MTLTSHAFEGNEMISAVVANGTEHAVYVENLHTGCSLGVLERSTDTGPDGWVVLPDCGSERLPLVLVIGPGRGRVVEIDPGSLEAAGEPLLPGTYRITVPWGESGVSGDLPHRVRSATFRIG